MRHTRSAGERSRSRAIIAGAVVMALCVIVSDASTRLDAQTTAASAAIPKLTGIWHRKGPLGGKPTVQPVPTNRAAGYDNAFDNPLSPTYDCVQIPIPSVMNDNYDFQITQQADRVIILYEKMDVVRTVWLEGHGHPKPGAYDYSIQGHSIGRYEGPTLIVETTKFLPDSRGFNSNRFIPATAMKKMTERYWRDGDILKMETVSVDPLVLRQPYHYDYEYSLRREPLTPYDCAQRIPDSGRNSTSLFIPPTSNARAKPMRRWLHRLSAARFTLAIVAVTLGWTVNASAHHSTSYFSKDLKDDGTRLLPQRS